MNHICVKYSHSDVFARSWKRGGGVGKEKGNLYFLPRNSSFNYG